MQLNERAGDRRGGTAPSSPRGNRDGSDLHLGVDLVPREWVDEFESTAAARYLERLAADQELIYNLQWAAFAGPEWERLAEAFIRYGYQVMLAWIASGAIFAHCRAKRFGGATMHQPRYITNRRDREEIAMDTVGFAIVKFRENVLLKNRWSAEGGATLKTFFMGQALIQFVGVYRSWLRMQNQNIVLFDPTDLKPEYDRYVGESAEDTALRNVAVDEALRTTLSAVETRQALVLVELGYSQVEVAEILGLSSAKAVEDKLYRHRKRVERHRSGGASRGS